MITLNIIGLDYYRPYEYFSLFGAFIMLLALCFILVLSWFLRKDPISFNTSEKQNLDNYILRFNSVNNIGNEGDSSKKQSLKTKITLAFIVIMLFLEPLYRISSAINFPPFY